MPHFANIDHFIKSAPEQYHILLYSISRGTCFRSALTRYPEHFGIPARYGMGAIGIRTVPTWAPGVQREL